MSSFLRRLLPVVVLFAVSCVTWGQMLFLPPEGAALPQFEVATIKPSSQPINGIYTKPAGRLIAGQCTVLCFAMEAFHVPTFGITGLPAWVKGAEFDLDALPPDDSPARKYNPRGINSEKTDDQRLMLQALLRDRFGFKYHVAKTEQPVFFLVVSGKRLGLKPPADTKERPLVGVIFHSDGVGNGELEGKNATMAFAAFQRSQIMGRTVIDQTNLPGAYDFMVAAPDTKDVNRTDATLEGLEALGLKLKSGKAMVDSIVVDAVSMPTPN